MNTARIRQLFLSFFAEKGHTVVPSSSLVPPADDKTLLFTNAGMNQFKDVFLGFDRRPYTRATSAQKCVRAGGKHNDLENVGYTARHHTFFEMLGNFSFGDYFKRDALLFAWEFLTSPRYLGLPPEKLCATVYAEDDEAYDVWRKEIGLPADKIIRIGDNKGGRYASDNFWQMGDTGPCGPCSEIFYDHGSDIFGGPPGSPDEDGDRFVEIWNCVFMQFNRDELGVMHPLPKPSVDTGMGLERIAAVMQGVHGNYDIDLFVRLMKAAARETGVPYASDNSGLKVIADHIRACAFLVADGIVPGNEGRAYVLRRIIRRAVRHGYKLGRKEPFFHRLVGDLVEEMGEAYPELRQKQKEITETLRQEELLFSHTLANGMNLLENALAGDTEVLDGAVAFKLYDTFGFPFDLTADICRERGVAADETGFEREMALQRARSRASQSFKAQAQLPYDGPDTEFTGYDRRCDEGRVVALYRDNEAVDELRENEAGIVVLSRTPFYAESGGQIGDVGYLSLNDMRFEVRDTQKIKAGVFGHAGVVLSGCLKTGEVIKAAVDDEVRDANMRNHSATHLMHAALRRVLGEHVEQKGSLVTSERTRFDISHPRPVSDEEIAEVEKIVNRAILANMPVSAQIMSMDEAKKTGAMMLFNEKYGERVRVLSMGDFSVELCGGTHVSRTGDIGMFKIVSEQGIAAGVRRIEAVTGLGALSEAQNRDRLIRTLIREVRAQTESDIADKIHALSEHNKNLEKSLNRAKDALARHEAENLLRDAPTVAGAKVAVFEAKNRNAGEIRDIAAHMVSLNDRVAVLLATVCENRVALCAAVSPALTGQIKAGDLVKVAARKVGGKGGGRPELAQAGGNDLAALPEALKSAQAWIAEKL